MKITTQHAEEFVKVYSKLAGLELHPFYVMKALEEVCSETTKPVKASGLTEYEMAQRIKELIEKYNSPYGPYQPVEPSVVMYMAQLPMKDPPYWDSTFIPISGSTDTGESNQIRARYMSLFPKDSK